MPKKALCCTHDQAFEIYHGLGAGRTHEEVRAELKRMYPDGRIPASSTITKWSKVYQWDKRIIALETEVAAKVTENVIEELADMRSKLAIGYHELHTELVGTVKDALAKLQQKTDDMDIGEMRQLMAMAIEATQEIRQLIDIDLAPRPQDADRVRDAVDNLAAGDPLAELNTGHMKAGERVH